MDGIFLKNSSNQCTAVCIDINEILLYLTKCKLGTQKYEFAAGQVVSKYLDDAFLQLRERVENDKSSYKAEYITPVELIEGDRHTILNIYCIQDRIFVRLMDLILFFDYKTCSVICAKQDYQDDPKMLAHCYEMLSVYEGMRKDFLMINLGMTLRSDTPIKED